MCYILLLVSFQSIAYQADWMGGSGVRGPVSSWGTQYWLSDSVTTATPGQASLIATNWDYSNWPIHIVENNPGILHSTQGFMPADIDGDGITDLVAYTADTVVWYKHNGHYTFSSKNIIGPAEDGGFATPCVYPCDLDQDDDIDVLVATNGVGVGWYENQNLTWQYYSLDNSTGYHRISATDVELDGDIDIIAVDNAIDCYCGNIYLFRDTTGNQDFRKESIVTFPADSQAWRVYPADFNNDGYPDLYAVHFDVRIFLNDSTGHFYESWSFDHWPGKEFDGAWAEDINMDGNMDLVCGNYYNFPRGFYGFLNDSGTGTYFRTEILALDDSYMDGAIARDIDLDGFPDIAGTLYKVGWFRQDPANPLTFTIHQIDTIKESHWIYAEPLCNRCTPAIDLLVTGIGSHRVYENQMLTSFAHTGDLESSMLEITTRYFEPCTLQYFAYDACVPNDTSLSFYWRAGVESLFLVWSDWQGPYPATVGLDITDSFAFPDTAARMFQYKAEFKKGSDIAVLYEVRLHYFCSGIGVEEAVPAIQKLQMLKTAMDSKLILKLPFGDCISLKLYDVTGRLVESVFDGYLSSGTHEFEILHQGKGIYFARLHSTHLSRHGTGREGAKTLKLIKLR